MCAYHRLPLPCLTRVLLRRSTPLPSPCSRPPTWGSCPLSPSPLSYLPDDELNVLLREADVCADLDDSMNELFERARPIGEAEDVLGASGWYSERRAQWEELWQ